MARAQTWRCILNARLLLALVGLAFCPAPSKAQVAVPDPANSSVSPADAFGGVIVCPNQPFQIPAAIETVILRNSANNPVPNVTVRLCLQLRPPLVWCQGQPDCWFGVSDNNGVVQPPFSLGVGGCSIMQDAAMVEWWDPAPPPTWRLLRTYPWVKSPDSDGNLTVNAPDLAYFWPPSPLKPCANYGLSPLANIMIFASAFSPTHHCP
jgi:hypothetical protein